MHLLSECREGGEARYGMRFAHEVVVTMKELVQFFLVGWAFTTHSTQGMSIDAPITVHDAEMMQRADRSILYTAITRCTKYEYLNTKETKYGGGDECGHFNGVIYTITHKVSGRVYVGATAATVTKDDTITTALNTRWEGHKAEAKAGTQSELYDAMREHGVAAFTGCVLAAHYVLPAPPRSFPVDIQTEIRNNEMAQKEGHWMDTHNARVTGYNKKSEGLFLD